ncbi:MAG: GYD domain-containing protein [Deltaproteobacteria bacterium]|nr:GYD domain-containing protein [Deltaproteobacteria bacterium]
MPTYITLVNFTQKGVENVKESPQRLDAAKNAFKGMGAELKDFYLVMGQYDIILVSEAPDDVTVAKIALTLGSFGNVRTESFRAFKEDEYREIVSALP